LRRHRHRAAVVATALGLSALTACGGQNGSGTDPTEPAAPPTAGSAPGATGSPKTPESPRSGDLAGKRIVIDPGHNGRNAANPGYINRQVDIGNGRKACDTTGTSTNDGYAEHEFAWDVSSRLADVLRERGAKVRLTRPDNNGRGPCIDQRAAIGNEFEADAVVSVHADGAEPSAKGFHIIEPKAVAGVNEPIVEKSHRLGLALRDAFKAGTGRPYSTYRGTRAMDPRDDLGGLNLSKVPKVFIECGNMKNPEEARMFVKPDFRQAVAISLANGFAVYFRR
jgi:N-acetylmuramoyl-L-alanine amidase